MLLSVAIIPLFAMSALVDAGCEDYLLDTSKPSPSTILDVRTINAILAEHNRARREVGAGTEEKFSENPWPKVMPMLTWNQSLADLAQTYMDTCPHGDSLKHSSSGYRRNVAGYKYVGENLAAGTSDKYLATQDGGYLSTKGWNDEIADYTYNKYSKSDCKVGKQCGHYTQNIWANTLQVGCGYAKCDSLRFKNYWGCNYGPRGNYMNMYPYVGTTNKSEAAECSSSANPTPESVPPTPAPPTDPPTNAPATSGGAGGNGSAPVTTSLIQAASTVAISCPYRRTNWVLNNRRANRMVFNYNRAGGAVANCSFVLSCPGNAAFSAVITQKASASAVLVVNTNVSASNATSRTVNSATGDSFVVATGSALGINAYGTGGKVAVQARCMPAALRKIPKDPSKINTVRKAGLVINTPATLNVADSGFVGFSDYTTGGDGSGQEIASNDVPAPTPPRPAATPATGTAPAPAGACAQSGAMAGLPDDFDAEVYMTLNPTVGAAAEAQGHTEKCSMARKVIAETHYLASCQTTCLKYKADSRRQIPISRRNYADNVNRAFMISCAIEDMSEINVVSQITKVEGSTGSDDKLTLTSMDSGLSEEFSGAGVSKTFTVTTNTSEFQASSGYYVLWETGRTTETDAGLVITYQCGTATWTVSGAGEAVAADEGTAGSAGAAFVSSVLSILAAALISFAAI